MYANVRACEIDYTFLTENIVCPLFNFTAVVIKLTRSASVFSAYIDPHIRLV